MKKQSNKMSRVNSEVQRAVSQILQNEVSDYRIHPMTTVLSCDVTTDLKYCKVYVSTFEGEKQKEETLAGLKNAAPFIRRELAAMLNMRYTPELHFYFDDTLEKALHMERLIDEVIRKDEENHEKNSESSETES